MTVAIKIDILYSVFNFNDEDASVNGEYAFSNSSDNVIDAELYESNLTDNEDVADFFNEQMDKVAVLDLCFRMI